MPFTFDFSLVGTGWARAKVTDDASSAEVTASYLGDALGHLLVAIWTLIEGDTDARCSWWEEPGECRWIFVRDGQRISLRILEFDRLWSAEPDETGRLIFQTSQPLPELAAAIATGAKACLSTLGFQGYRQKWVYNDFPVDELAAIEAAVESGQASLPSE
jgi:hypothetical protein